jgi:hypothetical protein
MAILNFIFLFFIVFVQNNPAICRLKILLQSFIIFTENPPRGGGAVNTRLANGSEHYKKILAQAENLDEALNKIVSLPKRQYTQKEIDEVRDNLALMNDRVFMVTFMDNKNNHIITGIVNALRKIHALAPIPAIERTTVQNISLLDVLGRGMVGDLFGWGESINIAVEVQKGKQEAYAVRGTITSSSAMRFEFKPGDDFTEAPDVIGVNILGFKLPELKNRKMFCSRIVRSEYDSKEPFLADKYSDYYIELPKTYDFKKADLPEEYHDLWDLCCIFRTKIKDHKEEIKMQAIANPVALELAGEAEKAASPTGYLYDILNRKDELERLRDYIIQQNEEAAQKQAEEMLITALQANAAPSLIEEMRRRAGITDARLAELVSQAKMA